MTPLIALMNSLPFLLWLQPASGNTSTWLLLAVRCWQKLPVSRAGQALASGDSARPQCGGKGHRFPGQVTPSAAAGNS